MGVHYDCELPFPILSLVVLKFSKVYRKQERVASHLDGRVKPEFYAAHENMRREGNTYHSLFKL